MTTRRRIFCDQITLDVGYFHGDPTPHLHFSAPTADGFDLCGCLVSNFDLIEILGKLDEERFKVSLQPVRDYHGGRPLLGIWEGWMSADDLRTVLLHLNQDPSWIVGELR